MTRDCKAESDHRSHYLEDRFARREPVTLADHAAKEPCSFGVRGFGGCPLAGVLEEWDGDQQFVMPVESVVGSHRWAWPHLRIKTSARVALVRLVILVVTHCRLLSDLRFELRRLQVREGEPVVALELAAVVLIDGSGELRAITGRPRAVRRGTLEECIGHRIFVLQGRG